MTTTIQQTQSVQAGTRRWPVGLIALTAIATILELIALYMIFFYAPVEATMGVVQRIFYTHVGSAWAGAVGFFVAVIMAVAYLITRKPLFDRLEHASVEVGLALVTIGLVGGMVWGNQVWGTPWTWDPKLTGFAVMWMSYAAYLMLREGIEDPDRRARFAAIYAIVAVVSVLFTYLGVRVIEATIHPYVVGEAASTSESDFGLTQRMTNTLLFNIATWTVIYVTLFWHRVRLRIKSDRLEELKTKYFLQQAGD